MIEQFSAPFDNQEALDLAKDRAVRAGWNALRVVAYADLVTGMRYNATTVATIATDAALAWGTMVTAYLPDNAQRWVARQLGGPAPSTFIVSHDLERHIAEL